MSTRGSIFQLFNQLECIAPFCEVRVRGSYQLDYDSLNLLDIDWFTFPNQGRLQPHRITWGSSKFDIRNCWRNFLYSLMVSICAQLPKGHSNCDFVVSVFGHLFRCCNIWALNLHQIVLGSHSQKDSFGGKSCAVAFVKMYASLMIHIPKMKGWVSNEAPVDCQEWRRSSGYDKVSCDADGSLNRVKQFGYMLVIL